MKIIVVTLALAAAIGSGLALWQQRDLSRLRQENAARDLSLASERDEAVLLASEREAAALREQTKELPKLRNEISQLRAAAGELAAARAEHTSLLEARRTGAPLPRETPPGFVSREQLRNAGQQNPEDTVQTMFWAMREGDLGLAMQCLAPDHRERIHYTQLTPGQRAQEEAGYQERSGRGAMTKFTDFSVGRRENIADDSVILHVRSSLSTNTFPFALKRVGVEWKVVEF